MMRCSIRAPARGRLPEALADTVNCRIPHICVSERVVAGLGEGLIELGLLAFHLGAPRFADGPEGPPLFAYGPLIVTTVIPSIVKPTS